MLTNQNQFIDQTMPKIKLTSSGGDQADIHYHGAQVTSWIPASGREQLFMSPRTDFGTNASIRGGIPVIFPQFCSEGPLIKHGFARRMDWKCVENKNQGEKISAIFQLKENPATRQIWNYAFTAELRVTIGNCMLETALAITNTDDQPFTFTGALHTYLRVDDIQQVTIEGLQEISYYESSNRQSRLVQTEKELRLMSEIDRFYMNAAQPLSLCTHERLLGIEMQGFKDVVIWNPWIEGTVALTDLEPQAYREMLCVEAAIIEDPVTLQPAQTWQGSQRLIA